MTEFLVCPLHGKYPTHGAIRSCTVCDCLGIPTEDRMLNIKLTECLNCGQSVDASNDTCTHCLAPLPVSVVTLPAKDVGTFEQIEYEASPFVPVSKPKRAKKVKQALVMPVFAGIPSFSAIVEGQPLPKGRPRFNGKTKKTYTPETTAVYEKLLIDSIAPMIDAPFTGLLCVELEFCRHTQVLADVDNLAKAVLVP